MAWEPESFTREQKIACTELIAKLQGEITETLEVLTPQPDSFAWTSVSRHCWRQIMDALSDAYDAMWKLQPPTPPGSA
jgi:hypothetical protein